MGFHSSFMHETSSFNRPMFEREQFPLDRIQALYKCTRLTDLDQGSQLQSRSWQSGREWSHSWPDDTRVPESPHVGLQVPETLRHPRHVEDTPMSQTQSYNVSRYVVVTWLHKRRLHRNKRYFSVSQRWVNLRVLSLNYVPSAHWDRWLSSLQIYGAIRTSITILSPNLKWHILNGDDTC